MKAALSGKYFPTKKDVDNICKAVCDGLNGVAYKDDRQIVDCHIRKLYDKEVDAEARIEVRIESI